MEGDSASVNFPLASTVTGLKSFSTSVSTVGGFDKALGLIQYASKMAILYHIRSDVTAAKSGFVTRLGILAKLINDSRTLFRFRGSIPLLANGLEISLGPHSKATAIMKLQILAMLAYYPLEHVYWLGTHGVLPVKLQTIGLAGLWSSRAWMTYNLLEVLTIYKRMRAIYSKKSTKLIGGENPNPEEFKQLWVHAFSMACYTYMSIHYSMIKSPFSSSSVEVAGFLAAVAAYAT